MIGDMDQDDQRSLPARAWPGRPGAWREREHEGGGEIVTVRAAGERLVARGYLTQDQLAERLAELAPGIVEEADLLELEGAADDPWVRGWHAGFADGKREARHRLAMARIDEQRERRLLVLQLVIVVAVIVLVLAIVLSI